MSLFLPVLIAALQFTGGKGEYVMIASDRCDFDRNEGVAYFDGNVRVDYNPGYIMTADNLYAFFEGTNRLDRIVAVGNVSVTNDNRFGTCDRAIFRRPSSEIEMYCASDDSPATLVDPGTSSVRGKRIKFWVTSEQVEVVGSEITINKGKDMKEGLKNL